jgi:hypothetical protein
LLSSDSVVQANGHTGIGNSLFQLGWKGLSGDAYPSDRQAVPDLARFDTVVKEALAKLRESESPDEGEAGGYVKFESLITNWADTVRHYDSTLTLFPSDKIAGKNRELTMTYLKRLGELLDQEKQDTEQSMPQPQPGEGQPQPGEGEPKAGEEGENGPKQPGQKGDGEKEPKDGKGDDGEKKDDGQKGKDKDKKDGDKEGENPNESPQERAHRILKENADLEKGPLTPGRREFRDAEKDW